MRNDYVFPFFGSNLYSEYCFYRWYFFFFLFFFTQDGVLGIYLVVCRFDFDDNDVGHEHAFART